MITHELNLYIKKPDLHVLLRKEVVESRNGERNKGSEEVKDVLGRQIKGEKKEQK